jgi:hypothetical protein
LLAAIVNVFAGVLLAWVLVRYRFPGRRAVDALIDLPFALPTAVAGIALTALVTALLLAPAIFAPDAGGFPRRVLATAPLAWLGLVSYGVYLWHWPLLVLAPFAVVGVTTTQTRIAVPLATVLLAWATKVLVEDPVRRSAWLSAQPRMTFACSAAATGVLAVVLLGGTSHVQAQIRAAERQSHALVATGPHCFGAAALDPGAHCENAALQRKVVPLPVAAKAEPNAPCPNFRKEAGVSVCEFGVAPAAASRTVALVGDSHASHWRAPLDAVARSRRWHGLSIARTSCVFSTATKLTPEPTRSQCLRWVASVPRFFRRHPEIDTVFIVGITGGHVHVPRGRTMFEAKMNGVRRAWDTLPDTVKQIVVIRDTPRITAGTIECIDRAIEAGEPAGRACARSRRAALERDPAVIAARKAHSQRIQAIDLNSLLCDRRRCFPVIGGALVYKDMHHFTLVFARTLAPPLNRKIEALTGAWERPG